MPSTPLRRAAALAFGLGLASLRLSAGCSSLNPGPPNPHDNEPDPNGDPPDGDPSDGGTSDAVEDAP